MTTEPTSEEQISEELRLTLELTVRELYLLATVTREMAARWRVDGHTNRIEVKIMSDMAKRLNAGRF